MNLTRRQEEFIRKLLDLYQQAHEPLHYTELAERLGVNRFTAYDMLRLLEEKGLAVSTYRLDEDKSGPGRSEVVFMPTDQAHQLLSDLAHGPEEGIQDWASVKEAILETIRSGEHSQLDLANKLLARIPAEEGEVERYCLEVMTLIALRLREGPGRQLLADYLPIILKNLDAGDLEDLSLLGGFALGVLARENVEDPQWIHELFEHVKRFQSMVIAMTPEQRRHLARSIDTVYATLK